MFQCDLQAKPMREETLLRPQQSNPNMEMGGLVTDRARNVEDDMTELLGFMKKKKDANHDIARTNKRWQH